MKKAISIAATVLTMVACTSTNPFLEEWNTPYGIPPFEKISVKDYMPAIKAGIEQQNAEIEAIVNNTEAPTFDNVIVALDRSGALLSKVSGVLFNLSESDSGPEINAVVEEASPLISEHSDNIYMNAALFAKVKAVYEADQSGLDREQQMLLKNFYDSFVKSGVGLDAESQERLRKINSELTSVIISFGNNLLDESNAYKAEIGASVSNYYDMMASTEDRALREKMFRLYSNRGNNGNEKDNKANLLKIMELRIEKAKLMGYKSPAEQILSDKMAGDPHTVDVFLKGIMDAATARAKEEVADMQAVMDQDVAEGKLPAGSRIEAWDYMYYAERIRKARFAFDESEVMQYFKMENVRAGVFATAGKLYGLSFEPVEGVSLYNPEAEAFKVSDADGSLIGIIITDYYPRDSKRAGAWMSNFVEQYYDANGVNVRPVIVNVGNFNKPTPEQPSLLTIDQVETMFHEFGHYYDAYVNPAPDILLSVGSLDIFEIHSTGMEALSTGWYGEIYGDEAELARIKFLDSALYSVFSGCLFDEFQCAVYADPTLTPEQISQTFVTVARSYGLRSFDREFSHYWMQVNHNFESPFYYISYAVSMLASLQIYELAENDWAQAASFYNDLVSLGAFDYTYCELLEKIGLECFTDGLPACVPQAVKDMEVLCLAWNEAA